MCHLPFPVCGTASVVIPRHPPHPCLCLPINHTLAGLEGDSAGPAEGQEDNAMEREVQGVWVGITSGGGTKGAVV